MTEAGVRIPGLGRWRPSVPLAAIVSLLPLAAFAVAVVLMLRAERADRLATEITAAAANTAASIRHEVQHQIDGLTALAISEALDRGDLPAIRLEMQRLYDRHPEWASLILTGVTLPDQSPGIHQNPVMHQNPGIDLRPIIDLRRAEGEALPSDPDPSGAATAITTRRPLIGNLTDGHLPVRVPVVRGGQVIFLLTALVRSGLFSDLLAAQSVPQGWILALADARHITIGRSARGLAFTGSPAPDAFRRGATETPGQVVAGQGRDGPVVALATPVAGTGWNLAVVVPQEMAAAPYSRVMIMLYLLGGAALIAAVVLAARGIGRDRRKRAAAAAVEADLLRQAAEEAASERDERSMRLAVMSHELRTPLAGVLGFGELLSRTALSAEQRHLLDRQAEAGAALRRIVDDVLDAARIEAGGMTLRSEPVDLRALATSVTEAARSGLAADPTRPAIEIVADPAPDLPARVTGDPDRLRQLMANLVGNAVKYTAQGTVRLRIGPRDVGGGRPPRLQIRVCDTGPGIPAALRDRLFRPFVTGSGLAGQPARARGGAGLGLYVCKLLAEAMGGRITVGAGVTGGTCFDVDLPLLAADIPVAPVMDLPPAPRAASLVPDPAPARGVKILLAEDTPANQILIRAILEGLGHQVVTAGDGVQALEQLAAVPDIDLVLMDMQMPRMDGLAATREIRRGAVAGAEAVPVIALTANAFPEDVDACLAAGMQRHLAKPIDPAALAAAVQEVAGGATSGPVAGPDAVARDGLRAFLLDLAPRLAGASAEELRRCLQAIRDLPDIPDVGSLRAAAGELETILREGGETRRVAAARAALLAGLDESLAALRGTRAKV
ncbi:ATP-binding protein [Tistrella mobilis]